MLEKNKMTIMILQTIKEDVIKEKNYSFNPVLLIGLDEIKRFNVFFVIYDKEFKSKYGNLFSYTTIEKIDLEDIKNKKLIILDNIQKIVDNKNMQDKLYELLDLCLQLKIQVILCSDTNINDLKIEELLKSKMLYGIQLYLEDNGNKDEKINS